MVDLSLLMPEFSDKLKDFVLEAQYAGHNIDVFSALRTMDEQTALYALGRTVKNPDWVNTGKPMGNIVTNAKAGQSWHNWGVAADIAFRDSNGHWTWNIQDAQYMAVAQIAKQHGLEWGGDFNSIKDLPHFQFTAGISILEAQKLGKIVDVWNEIRWRL
jgi:peptidoglycan LD-endopeptidase CwlK